MTPEEEAIDMGYGKVYRLTDGEKSYIGSTFKPLCIRLIEHRSLCKTVNSTAYKYFRQIFESDPSAVVIEELHREEFKDEVADMTPDQKENFHKLRILEQKFIELEDKGKLLNKNNAVKKPYTPTGRPRGRPRLDKSPEDRLTYNKTYYQKNKEIMQARNKAYYEKLKNSFINIAN